MVGCLELGVGEASLKFPNLLDGLCLCFLKRFIEDESSDSAFVSSFASFFSVIEWAKEVLKARYVGFQFIYFDLGTRDH